MLGNIKDFLSVVQEGLTSNSNLRYTLEEVQKVKNIFKDKQIHSHESKVNYGAGGALLEKYQKDWEGMHDNAEQNAKAAEEVDKVVLELHEDIKTQLQSATKLADNLAYLPNLTATVAQCINSIKNVQILMSAVEGELVEFEDFVERIKMEKWKLDHHYHLTLYKEKKMSALEETRLKLAKENTLQTNEYEKKQLTDLQMKRDTSALAFQQDVAKYLMTGVVPPGSSGSPTITLDQVQLDVDNQDLENFLDS